MQRLGLLTLPEQDIAGLDLGQIACRGHVLQGRAVQLGEARHGSKHCSD
jgi:hypothetical protein